MWITALICLILPVAVFPAYGQQGALRKISLTDLRD